MSNGYKDWEQENKMEQEKINKFLTESMGDCWHEWHIDDYAARSLRCGICKVGRIGSYAIRPDFFTWDGFGKLISYLDGEWSDEMIADMLYALTEDGNVTRLPENAAMYVYGWLQHEQK